MCMPSGSGTRGVESRLGASASGSSTKWHDVARPSRHPCPAVLMQVPPRGLPSAATGVSGMWPGAAIGRVPMTGLKETFAIEAAKSCSRRKRQQGGVSCRPSSRRSCRQSRSGTPATAAHVRDDPVERALPPAQRAHAVVRLAVAVERDLHAVQAEGVQPVHDFRRQQQAVGDDVDRASSRRAPGPPATGARPAGRPPAG
jgi:hypothetical protein